MPYLNLFTFLGKRKLTIFVFPPFGELVSFELNFIRIRIVTMNGTRLDVLR